MELLHRGKVRDVYSDRPGEILLVATDRISTYDVVHPTPVPDKGKVLTAPRVWSILPAVAATFADRSPFALRLVDRSSVCGRFVAC